ncbi:MAG: hypothetical protein IJ329_01285 [Clostridia bacterium]|nr:hypothetical protein [Clostridia bacterium]
MSKKTRAEKRAEEARIIAEMEGVTPAVSQNTASTENQTGKYASNTEKIYCKRCKSVMDKGVCPVCGYRVYTPMEEETRKRIRAIVTVGCIAVFLALFFILRIGR